MLSMEYGHVTLRRQMPGKIFAWHNMDNENLSLFKYLCRSTEKHITTPKWNGRSYAQGNLEEREPVCNKIKWLNLNLHDQANKMVWTLDRSGQFQKQVEQQDENYQSLADWCSAGT